MNVSIMGIFTTVGILVSAWLCLLFRKLKRLENERAISKIHADSAEEVHNKSLDSLIQSTNEDESRRIR